MGFVKTTDFSLSSWQWSDWLVPKWQPNLKQFMKNLTAVPYLASKKGDTWNLRHLHIHFIFSLPVKIFWCLQQMVCMIYYIHIFSEACLNSRSEMHELFFAHEHSIFKILVVALYVAKLKPEKKCIPYVYHIFFSDPFLNKQVWPIKSDGDTEWALSSSPWTTWLPSCFSVVIYLTWLHFHWQCWTN